MTDPTTALARQEPTLTPFEVIERVISTGDLGRMSPEDRVAFYWRTCESLGLNPLTRPFEYISLNNKLTLYARKDATDQLRRLNGVSVTGLRREVDATLGLLTVYASVRDDHGRIDEASGVVSTKGLAGEALANAVMKAETKAKRRATLSLVGLGFLDESEVDGGDAVQVDPETGVISEPTAPRSLLEQVQAAQENIAGATAVTAEAAGATIAAAQKRLQEAEPVNDAPQQADEVEVPAPATEPDDAQPDQPAAAEGDDDAPATLTEDEFFAQLDAHKIARQYAAEVAKSMFPASGAAKPLTDTQRALLLASLLS